jgi:hypothetical protein
LIHLSDDSRQEHRSDITLPVREAVEHSNAKVCEPRVEYVFNYMQFGSAEGHFSPCGAHHYQAPWRLWESPSVVGQQLALALWMLMSAL